MLDVFESHFEPWPLLPPENLDQIHQAKKLFLLLVNRPQAPADLSVESLCFQANTDIILAAIKESEELRCFRLQNAERISFGDLPHLESISALKREVRSYSRCWWRWLSSRYRKARKAVRVFLNPPYTTDEAALATLGRLRCTRDGV